MPEPSQGVFSPPSCMTHRRSVTEELGGWRDYRQLDEWREVSPDMELWRRAQAAGKRFTFVPRLSGIKFPAALRPGVYRQRPSHEQAQWLARIDAEPQLEPALLAECVAGGQVPGSMPFRRLLRYVVNETAIRIRRRLKLRSFGMRLPWRGRIDDNRRFKGLEDEDNDAHQRPQG